MSIQTSLKGTTSSFRGYVANNLVFVHYGLKFKYSLEFFTPIVEFFKTVALKNRVVGRMILHCKPVSGNRHHENMPGNRAIDFLKKKEKRLSLVGSRSGPGFPLTLGFHGIWE